MAIPYTTGPVGLWPLIPPPASAAAGATAAGVLAGAGVTAPVITGGVAAGVTAAIANLSRTPVFLGTGERGARIKIRRRYSPVFNDITGPETLFDLIYAGRDALVFSDLTRWNEGVYQALSGTPNLSTFSGLNLPGDVGSLMMTEGKAYPLVLRFPHWDTHPLFRANGMPAGIRFACAMLAGDDDWETGTSPNKRHVAFHCIQAYNPRTNGLGLYDFSTTGVPALFPN